MTAPMPTRERLSRAEYDEARKAGYSEEEIRAEYDVDDGGLPSLGDQGQAADASRVDPNRLPPGQTVGPIKAAAQSAVNAATFGLADEAVGALGALIDKRPDESRGDAYTRLRDQMRDQSRRGREQQPIASGVGTVAGALAVPTPGAVTALKALNPTTRLGQVAAGATIGAGAGALQGFGEGEGSMSDQLRSVARGTRSGAIGGAVAGAAPAAYALGKRGVDAARRNPREALAIGRTAARAGNTRGPAIEDAGVLARWLGKKMTAEPSPRFTGLGQDVTVDDLSRGYQPVRSRGGNPLDDVIARETGEAMARPRKPALDMEIDRVLGERPRLEMTDLPADPNLFKDAPEAMSIPLMDRPGLGLQEVAEQGGALRRPASSLETLSRGGEYTDELSRLSDQTIPFPTQGTDPVLRGAPSRGPEQMIDASGRSVERTPQSLWEAVLDSRADRGVPLLDRASEDALMQSPAFRSMMGESGVEQQVASRLSTNPIAKELQSLGVGLDEIERIMNYSPDEYQAWVESIRRGQRGPTRARLQADEARLGLPAVTPDPPRSRPELGAEPSLEELLARSLENPRPKGAGVSNVTPNQARTNARRDAADKVWSDRRERWGEWSKANPAPAEMQPRLKLEREIRDLEKQAAKGGKDAGFVRRQLQRRREELGQLKTSSSVADLLRNESGRIGPLYHGSDVDFQQFDPNRFGRGRSGEFFSMSPNTEPRMYLTSTPGHAENYGTPRRWGLKSWDLAEVDAEKELLWWAKENGYEDAQRFIDEYFDGDIYRALDADAFFNDAFVKARRDGKVGVVVDFGSLKGRGAVQGKTYIVDPSIAERLTDDGKAALGMMAGTAAAAGAGLTGGLMANRKKKEIP